MPTDHRDIDPAEVARLYEQWHELRDRITRLEGDSVRRAEFSALQAQLGALERDVARVERSLETLTQGVNHGLDAVKKDILTVGGDVKSILARDQGRREGADGVQPGGMTVTPTRAAAIGVGGAGAVYALVEAFQAIMGALGRG